MPADNAAWGGASLTVLIGAVDVSCDVLELIVDRSKNRLWDPHDAGTCHLTLDIGPGGQPASRAPVGASVRVKIGYRGTERWLFTGIVQRRLLDTNSRQDLLIIDAVDEFERLGRVQLRAGPLDTPEGAGDTIADRLGRWLDAAGSTSDRAFDLSDFTCPETMIDGNVLRQLQAAAQADGGDLFVAGDGTITFLAWRWRDLADTPAAIFSDRLAADWVPYTAATYNDDLDEVQNHVVGTRRKWDATDPVPQTATNSSSITSYGERGDPLDDLELEDDTQVATRVTSLVEVAAMPNPRFDAITVQPAFAPARSWPRTIPVTVGSLVAANRVWADGTQAALLGHVIGERWTFNADDASVVWRCTGTGSWDAGRPPRPPIAIEYCPDGSIRVPPGTPCDTTSDVVIKDCDGAVLATYPPGSLCECGVVFPPDGACEVCLDDGVTAVCFDLEDPRLHAILWVDVLEPGPDLIERIDRDGFGPGGEGTYGPGFGGTNVDAIPGGFDAINANLTGGLIAESHSDHVEAADLAPGWTIDLWLYTDDYTLPVGTDDPFTIVDLGVLKLQVTAAYDPPIADLEVVVIDSSAVAHLSGPLAPISPAQWQHWVVRYSAAADDAFLVFLDGTLARAEDGFPGAPDAPTGNWQVKLPAEWSIGEVIVYADRPLIGHYDETVLADGPFAYWTFDAEVAGGGGGGGYDGTVTGDTPFAYWPLDAEV